MKFEDYKKRLDAVTLKSDDDTIQEVISDEDARRLYEIYCAMEEHSQPVSGYGTRNPDTGDGIRERYSGTDATLRGQFAIDIDKIVNNKYYNRYSDKTQVFSFYKNDEITRRGTHVQLVSRIARTISKSLGLNEELTEAIALGHDMGHTPFGHVGEKYLDSLYFHSCGKHFNHNVNSVRCLREVTDANLTVQTLDGIICHNGEKPAGRYTPSEPKTMEQFIDMYKRCYTDAELVKNLKPFTLEGCVVRVSDIIAYVMKDRQDVEKLGFDIDYDTPGVLGDMNYKLISRITRDIVLNSYGKNYIEMSPEVYEDLIRLKKENYQKIYKDDEMDAIYNITVKPMMEKLYNRFLDDIKQENKDSYIYTHHIDTLNYSSFYEAELANPDDVVVDYIAGMTDDYFIDIYHKLYGNDALMEKVNYIGYFDADN